MQRTRIVTLLITTAVAVASLAYGAEPKSTADPTMELNQMDKRVPVPLTPHMAHHQKQNMREHLESVQAIVAGLMKQDFKAIEVSATQMGFTPEMGKMCQHMGAGADGFSERAVQFHKTADEIAKFARKKDQAGVFRALNHTLTQCTSCHATYRQQVVDQATYDLLAEKPKSK